VGEKANEKGKSKKGQTRIRVVLLCWMKKTQQSRKLKDRQLYSLGTRIVEERRTGEGKVEESGNSTTQLFGMFHGAGRKRKRCSRNSCQHSSGGVGKHPFPFMKTCCHTCFRSCHGCTWEKHVAGLCLASCLTIKKCNMPGG